MDYDSLKTQISQYANRDDQLFMDLIPDFINQAIARIYSEARSIGFQKIQNGNFVAGQALIDKNMDWKETISFQYTIPGVAPFATYLLPRTYEFCTTYWPNVTAQETPLFYADYNLPTQTVGNPQFFISPTPNANYAFQIMYLSLPLFTAVGGQDTNFLTDRYPQLLLYACMLESVPFLKNNERIPVYESLYNRALQDINRDSKERYTDRISKRDKE